MFKGTLEYHGWNDSWILSTAACEAEWGGQKGTSTMMINIKQFITAVFERLHGKSASQVLGMDSYELKLDDESKFQFCNEPNPLLDMKDGSGFSNVGAYFSTAMEWLNGRKVILTTDATGFKIEADPEDKVHELKFSGSGNLCNVSKGDALSVCLVGQGDNCCIFLMGGGSGFSCAKFSSFSRQMLDRHAKGTMNAGRIGNCAIVGREDE